MKFTRAALAALFAVAASQAHASFWSISAGAYSAQSGARTETFDSVGVDAHESLNLSLTGGAIFSSSISGITARPPGSVGNFLSVGTSGGQTGPINVDLSTGPASYYGFLWGSPDAYNTVSFFDGNVLLAAFTGSTAFGANRADGFQGAVSGGQYFNFFASTNEEITRVVFTSTGNAFETDNHAIASAVPEPASLALLLGGLGLMAFVRRRQAGVATSP